MNGWMGRLMCIDWWVNGGGSVYFLYLFLGEDWIGLVDLGLGRVALPRVEEL